MLRLFFIVFFTLSHSLAIATSLKPAVDNLINHVDPAINMGIKVVDLDTGEVIYERNANKPFVPASNMKLFSDAAALLALGPDYRFQTKLLSSNATITQGVLKGSLYLELPGDPSFTQENLHQLLAQLSHFGIQQIDGDVIIDSNREGVDPYTVGIVPKDLNFGYGAPLAPVMLDENRFTITVNPAWREGLPAYVELTPHNSPIHLNNQIKTATANKPCGISFKMIDKNELVLRGCIRQYEGSVQERLAIRDPWTYMQNAIRAQLKQLGIQLNGDIVLGQAPESGFLLASHDSKPIKQLITDTLKNSDNLYADSLYLNTAARLNNQPANWPVAENLITQFLQQQTGIQFKQASLKDGSGLSRRDLVTAEQTVELLRFLHGHFPLAYEYVAALPIAGRDGTLVKRFRKRNEKGLLRAKTGTMTGIHSLSGYLSTANGHTLAFAIFVNKTKSTNVKASWGYSALVDKLCTFFMHQNPDTQLVNKSHRPYTRVAFQQQPSATDNARKQSFKWRKLEYELKKSLKNEPVNVIFRSNQLLLQDQGANINKVWAILRTLNTSYSFSVALESSNSPTTYSTHPTLLWMKSHNEKQFRTWTIRDLNAFHDLDA